MLKGLLLLLTLLIVLKTPAQVQLNGIVVNARTKEPLPFVNIGIKQKNTGTVSDENGLFSITIPEQYSNDSLTFLIIGFNNLSIPINTIKQGQQISLSPCPRKLNEVFVTDKKLKERKIGITRNPLLHFIDASIAQNDIFEIAEVINLGKDVSKITNVNLHINEYREDSGTFRINFYAYDGYRPGKRLVEQNIIQTHPIRPGWAIFNLSSYSIYLAGKIVVAIEFIPSAKKNLPIAYEIKPGSRSRSFMRKSSLGIWEIPPHRYRMYITALGTASPLAEDEDEQEVLSNFKIYSQYVQDSFFIFLRLPRGYNNNPTKKYNTLYLTDGNFYFPPLDDTLNKITSEQPILIGIGYRNFADADSLRNRDYTYPVALKKEELSTSGGAEQFYQFIKKELVPHIDTTYRTTPGQSTLMGHSLGGYFSLYTLYRELETKNNTFNRYIAASPSIDYNDEYLVHQFATLGISPLHTSNSKVYITWSTSEEGQKTIDENYNLLMMKFTLSLHNLLQPEAVQTETFPNISHMGTAIPSFYHSIDSQ